MKKFLTCLLACIMLLSVCSFASAESYTFPASGITVDLPLVKEPTTFEIWTWNDTAVNFQENYNWKWLTELTGITFNFTTYNDHNQMNLEYAAGNYPDIILRFGNADVKEEMIEAGEIVNLADYKELIPDALAFLERTGFLGTVVREDGSIYSLPSVNLSADGTAAWDLFYINRAWCEELNLPIPTTIEDLVDTLKAFRDNAGKGSIPEFIVPYYLNYATSRNYQAQTTLTRMMNAFGVPFGGYYEWMYWDEESQTVKPNADMEGFKACVKFFAECYKENLLAPTFFTDLEYADTNAVYSVLASNPYVGLISWYSLPKAALWSNGGAYWPVAFSGTKDGTFTANYSQGMKTVVWDTNFMITTKCPDIEAAVKLGNMMAIPEIATSLGAGREGHSWKINDEGKMEWIDGNLRPEEERPTPEETMKLRGCDCAMLDRRTVVTPTSMTYEGSRLWTIENLYAPYIAKNDYQLPNLPGYIWDDQDVVDTRNDINNEVSTYIGEKVAQWIVGNGDIDAEWEDYLATLEEYGYYELIDIWTDAVVEFRSLTK